MIPSERKRTDREDFGMVSHMKKSIRVKQKGQRLNQSG